MKKALLGALLATATMVAQASTVQNIESSAVVNGTIVLAKDGTVQTAIIDHPAKYGQPIADMVRKAAMQYRFHPVLLDGEPVMAKFSMHARVVVKKMPGGSYTVRIKGATFGDDDPNDTSTLHKADGDKKIMAYYPEVAIRGRVQGTVYMALHVDRSGHVTEAVAEQVNLSNTGPERILKKYRDILAKSALTMGQKWTFVIPTTGKLANRDSWTVRMSVTYRLNTWGAPKSEQVWQTYVPGPYTPAPWVDKPDADAADALVDDAVQTDGAGPTLLAPVNHG